ncbi:hypothetical protein EYF80_046422 [Liparis tanakae]|uniref:Uncharacterized protein n=1 Tax=Liparis tanakae TaxID=230148 RepID=A0A4Z2FRP9_9TELE|nr:hypothetical protein EYF80_046422 [Liparis tanakae]
MEKGGDRQRKRSLQRRRPHVDMRRQSFLSQVRCASVDVGSPGGLAQLCCGRRERGDDAMPKKALAAPGPFLTGELTFTLGGCGMWLMLPQK